MFNVVFHLAHTWIVIIGFRERLHLMHAQTGHRHINGVSSAWDFCLRNRMQNTPISAKSLVRFASSSLFSRLIHSGKKLCVISFKMLRFFLGVWFGWAEPPEFRLFVFIFFAVFFSVHSVLSVELMCSYHGAIELSERASSARARLVLVCAHSQCFNTFSLHKFNSIIVFILSLSHFLQRITHSKATSHRPRVWWYSLPSNLNIFYYCHTFPHIYLHW